MKKLFSVITWVVGLVIAWQGAGFAAEYNLETATKDCVSSRGGPAKLKSIAEMIGHAKLEAELRACVRKEANPLTQYRLGDDRFATLNFFSGS